MNTLNYVSTQADSYMKAGLSNPYVMALLKIALLLYAAQLAPRVPSVVSDAFQNTYVKIVALFVIAYVSNLDFQLAIILSIVFVLGMNYLSGRGFFESFADYSDKYEADKRFTLIEPKSVVYPGCHDIKMADLEAAFGGDAVKLQDTVMYSYKHILEKLTDKESKDKLKAMAYATGLPYNVKMNDENAPYIATILLYAGFKFGETCMAPQNVNPIVDAQSVDSYAQV
jgi:hypothetical protein